MRRLPSVVIVALGVLAAGCGGGDSVSTPTPEPTAPEGQFYPFPTPWQLDVSPPYDTDEARLLAMSGEYGAFKDELLVQTSVELMTARDAAEIVRDRGLGELDLSTSGPTCGGGGQSCPAPHFGVPEDDVGYLVIRTGPPSDFRPDVKGDLTHWVWVSRASGPYTAVEVVLDRIELSRD